MQSDLFVLLLMRSEEYVVNPSGSEVHTTEKATYM